MDELTDCYLSQIFELDGRIDIPGDTLGLIRSTLSREEERGGPRDQWGNWIFSFQDSFRCGQLFVPWLDKAVIQSSKLARKALWPEGRSFALGLTHDVDLVNSREHSRCLLRKLRAVAGSAGSGAPATEYARLIAGPILRAVSPAPVPELDFCDWLKLEEKYSFRSTFFFMSDRKAAPHACDHFYNYDDMALFDGKRMSVRDVMRQIAASGWEIGLHGSFNSAVEPGLLRTERGRLASAIEHDVVSGRQHWLHFDPDVTPRLLAESGLQVDSTHGFSRCTGFRAGTAFSYHLYDHAADHVLPICEFPQHVMDGALFAPQALELSLDAATRHVLDLMDEVEAVGGIFVLNFHPHYWHTCPTWRRLYEEVLAEARHRNAWGCSLRDLHLEVLSSRTSLNRIMGTARLA